MSVRFTVFSIFVFLSRSAAFGAPEMQPQIPFTFVANHGQAETGVRYLGAGAGLKAWFRDTAVVFQHGSAMTRMTFEGAGAVRVDPDLPTGARANYLFGRDSTLWLKDLPIFGAIRYTGLWADVEMICMAEGGGLRTEYLTSAGGDVSHIHLRFDGDTRIQADGTLLVSVAGGELTVPRPLVLERVRAGQRPLDTEYQKLPDGSIGLSLVKPLNTGVQTVASDRNILISGYFGGNSEDNITAIAVDSLNNLVVAGWTTSSNLPTSGGEQKKYGGSVDAFVASFLPNGGGLNYCTYLGGSGDDRAFGIAVDSGRNVYITGWTSSVNFPVVSPIKTHLGGTRDAFVAKLAPSGNSMVYSTYLGGSGVDVGYSIGLNVSTGNAVVAGDTTSTDFPVTAGVVQPQSRGGQDVFVATISTTGTALVYSTYLGGSGVDHAASVSVGPSGGIFVGGYTWSTNFPVVGAQQPSSSGGQQGFVFKMRITESGLSWSTYLGGSGGSIGAPQEVTSVHVNPALCANCNNVIVGGITGAPDFPVTGGAFQTSLAGDTDGFVALLSNSSGYTLQATYLGGSLADSITAVAGDFYGDIYVTGSTSSVDFPVKWPFQAANAGSMDAFVVKLNPSLSNLLFGSYLGGTGSDSGNAIAVDNETSIMVVGQTSSGNFPAEGNLANSPTAILTSFLTKIAPNFTLGVSYGYLGQSIFVADPWHVAAYLGSTAYGNATDIAIVGDWTGTGTKEIGVFRNGTWYLDTNNNGVLDAADKTVVFGQAGDIPVVGDWRGTGRVALGLFRQGTFILDLSGHLTGVPTGLSDASFTFGQGGDIPIVADWSGSGTTKVGVFRNGLWIEDYSGGRVYNSSANRSYVYGQAGDLPVVGDWDSSGNPPKIGIFRQGLWVLDYDGDNTWTIPGLNEMTIGLGFTGNSPLVF